MADDVASSSSASVRKKKKKDKTDDNNNKIVQPFWSADCKVASDKLWIPVVDSNNTTVDNNCHPGIFSPTFSPCIAKSPWFNIKKWRNTDHATCGLVDTEPNSYTILKGGVDNPEPPTMRTVRVSLWTFTKGEIDALRGMGAARSSFLSTNRKRVVDILKSWAGQYRWTYNKIVQYVRDEGHKSDNIYPGSWKSLQMKFVTQKGNDLPEWLDSPSHVRRGAVKEFTTAYKGNMTKLKQGAISKFHINFKTRKADELNILLPKDMIRNWLLPTTEESSTSFDFSESKLRAKFRFYFRKHNIPMNSFTIDHDCRLVLDKSGRLFVHIPTTNDAVSARDNQAGCPKRWCSLDPGVRCFQTAYSPTTGVAYTYGDGDIGRIARLFHHEDKLKSKASKESRRGNKRRIRLAMWRLRSKIKNLVDDIHHKAIRHLCQEFDNIIIPPFQVSDMVVKDGGRKINRATTRKLLAWRHFSFRQRLLYKARLLGVDVYVRTEEYTTKTCGRCGAINNSIGGSKTFKCPSCGLKAERDIHGARNIFIKNATIVS